MSRWKTLVRRAVRRAQSILPDLGGTTVLAYHLVDAATASPVDLSRTAFGSQLQQLAALGTIVPLGAVTGDREVVLTFDDAYANFYEVVWPLLVGLQLPATLYVPYDFVDGRGPAPITGTQHLPACSWSQLREMVEGGLDIGSHSITHRNLLRLSPEDAHREIADSKHMLEDKLGAAVESFCYPQAKWNRALEDVVRATYRTAVVGGGTKLRGGRTHPWRIPRVSIRRDMPENLVPLLETPVCLEEAAGDLTRRFRR